MISSGRYRHYKGNDYEVIGIARHSESEEELIAPQRLGLDEARSIKLVEEKLKKAILA